MRIIHIVENLNKGAVENWLVKTFLESQKSSQHEWTFFCVLGKPGVLDETVTRAGGKIIYSPYTLSQKKEFLQFLRQTLKKGQYDFFHSHHDYLTGFYLLATIAITFKGKFVHVHNCEKSLPVGNPLLHKLLLKTFSVLIQLMADKVIGVSKHTLKEFGLKTKEPGKVIYCGVDFQPFEKEVNVNVVKAGIGVPISGKILLFVGRLYSFKNPLFVLEILKEILTTKDNFYAVFVGKGELEEKIRQVAKDYNIEVKIRLLGYRQDIPELMKASDALVFPRVEEVKEGLGLVVVEAQAAGLPVIVSNGIVEDAFEIGELVKVVPLKNNVEEWANEIIKKVNSPKKVDKKEALEIMKNSKFSIINSTKQLLSLYNEG